MGNSGTRKNKTTPSYLSRKRWRGPYSQRVSASRLPGWRVYYWLSRRPQLPPHRGPLPWLLVLVLVVNRNYPSSAPDGTRIRLFAGNVSTRSWTNLNRTVPKKRRLKSANYLLLHPVLIFQIHLHHLHLQWPRELELPIPRACWLALVFAVDVWTVLWHAIFCGCLWCDVMSDVMWCGAKSVDLQDIGSQVRKGHTESTVPVLIKVPVHLSLWSSGSLYF